MIPLPRRAAVRRRSGAPERPRLMLVIPSIDLLGGTTVRLRHGSFADVTTYPDDPVEVARQFVELGARWIHVVDLDAARGSGDNRGQIAKIAGLPVAVEVGGGIRHADDVTALLDVGVERLIVGTVLAQDPDTVAGWIDRFGTRFVAGIDADDGQVRVSGWQEAGDVSDLELIARIDALDLCGIVYTSIGRDGTLSGPDIERTVRVANAARVPVVLSGGIGSTEDLVRVRDRTDDNVAGAITGKAVYEGRVDLARAFQLCHSADERPW